MARAARSRAAVLLVGFVLAHAAAWAEEDAVSFEERRTEEEEEEPGPLRAGYSGDTRFRFRGVRPPGSTFDSAPPELQNRPYAYNRTRLRRGGVSAGWLAKRASPGPALSLSNLAEYGVLKGSLEARDAADRRRLVAGNYTLALGQGLLYYDGFGEFVRPVRVRDNGPRSDFTGGQNDYLIGPALRWGAGVFRADLFASEKPLDFPLNPDGSVNGNLDDLHETSGDVQDARAVKNNNTVRESLAGARLGLAGTSWRAGAAASGTRFSRPFNPAESDYADARAYRGDRLTLASLDADVDAGPWRFFGEGAVSRAAGPFVQRPGGSAWTATALLSAGRSRLWMSLFDYDPDFVSPHGKGLAYGVSGGPESLPRNQAGGVLGAEWKAGRWSGRANATLARFPEAVGNGVNTGALAPSGARYLLADQRWRAAPGVEFRFQVQHREEEKLLPDPADARRRQVIERVDKWRAGFQWKAGPRFEWGARYDERVERVPAFEERRRGRLCALDAVARPGRTTIKSRVYVFKSPEAFLTTGPEEIWDGVVYDRLAGNLGSLRGEAGTRFYVIAKRDWGPVSLWAKFDQNRRPAQAEGRSEGESGRRSAWHVQLDGRFGPK